MQVYRTRLTKPFVPLLTLAVIIITFLMGGCLGQPTKLARLTILISGDVEGYLKNCGCSGGQVGGEVRSQHET